MKVEINGDAPDAGEYETGAYSVTLTLEDGRILTVWGNGMYHPMEPTRGHAWRWLGHGHNVIDDLLHTIKERKQNKKTQQGGVET